MTKARTLATFDSTGLLTSSSSLDATKLTGNLPALNGSALTDLAGGGKVLQVIEGKTDAQTIVSSSNSYASDTLLTATITPTNAANSILCFVSQTLQKADETEQSRATLQLLINNNVECTFGDMLLYNHDASQESSDAGGTNLRVAGTTNALVYKTHLKKSVNSPNGAFYAGASFSGSTLARQSIILMEIAA